MTKLVRLITQRQEEELRLRGIPPNQINALTLLNPNDPNQSTEIIDPSSLLFVRAVHPFETTESAELKFKNDEIIAVLTSEQERKQSQWWRGRTRDGRIGWFPAKSVFSLRSCLNFNNTFTKAMWLSYL